MSKKETTRVCTSEEFERRRKHTSALAMIGMPTGMRTAFEMEWHDSFFLQDTHLSGEPTLEDEIAINGEKWEIWQGIFVGRGCFGGAHYVLILCHAFDFKKDYTLWDARHYSWNTLGSTYLDWKWFLEYTKQDTVVDFFTRLVNKEEHQGVLSKIDVEPRGRRKKNV